MNQPVINNPEKMTIPSDSKDLPNFYFTKRHFNNPNIIVGDYTYGKPNIRWLMPGRKVIIGKFCSIAPEVEFFVGGNHRADYATSYPFSALKKDWPEASAGESPVSKGDIVIGNDVWFGTGAKVLSGVRIGDGAVIGAYAIVTKDVPPYGIAVGNPAKVIKKRFSDEVIKKLLKLKWWDWSEEKIRKNLPLMCSTNVKKFLKEVEG